MIPIKVVHLDDGSVGEYRSPMLSTVDEVIAEWSAAGRAVTAAAVKVEAVQRRVAAGDTDRKYLHNEAACMARIRLATREQ